jgi:hypothetical protein
VLEHHIGEKLQVSYQLRQANGGKAWIGLVPEAVSATDLAANDAADIAASPTVDAPSALVNVDAAQVGRFRLRLFESREPGARLLAESKVLTITQWPLGNREARTPPYVTINAVGAKGPAEVEAGMPVVAYFELPEGYDAKGWLGAVPADLKSPLEIDNDAAAVTGAVMYLSGKTKDSYTWKPDKPGKYVFRVFPSGAPGADYVAESEEFTVVPKKS